MALKESEIIALLAKFLSERGEIVKVNENNENFVIGTKEYKPDLFTIDKDNVVTGIYEIKLSVDETMLQNFKELADSVNFYLVVPEKEETKAKDIIKRNKIKVKEVYTFTE